MEAFIAPPQRIPFYLRAGIWLAGKMAKRELLPPKLLAWYPPVAFSSGVLEALIAHHDGKLDERMLQLTGCPCPLNRGRSPRAFWSA
jgi:hypothetical protein